MKENIHGHRKKLLFFLDRIEQFRKHKGLEPSQIEILDIGCGNGTGITLPIGEQGYSVLGIDIHEPSINYAKRMNKLSNVKFITCNFYDLPLTNKFDVIVLSDILEHLQHPAGLLGQSKMLLKRDGIVLISIPNGYGLFELENFLWKIGFLKFLRKIFLEIALVLGIKKKSIIVESYNYDCTHVHFFRRRRLTKFLASLGYKIAVFEKGCFMGSMISGILISKIPMLIQWNLALGQMLPHYLISVWYFECRLFSHAK